MKKTLLTVVCVSLGLIAIACAPSANPPRATPASPSPSPQESSAPITQVKPPQEAPPTKP
ncbi:hypothetical protein JOY44_02365 [Phormidium sp. CLA17]|uniref:hypothetical protein n=1 Tax=Leptolyngbya sp. Cla-17 TaxID=2803751 RepID=UPI001491EE91|nr:hypothetical protein [Leptolyngbya sp. Cla-17]MBM0740469.1 hypothetical protein [Leptolyngbya sp. Cla-17]